MDTPECVIPGETPVKQACKKCGLEKPLTREYWQWDKSQKAFIRSCRECRRAYCVKWRVENPEKERTFRANYYATNPEKKRAWNNKWRLANPEKERARHANQHARRKGAEGSFTWVDEHKLWEKQKGLCKYCDKKLNPKSYHRDHIHPIARGGLNYIQNIALCCPRCNHSKGMKTLTEWVPPKFR